jgi:hypothetical protein
MVNGCGSFDIERGRSHFLSRPISQPAEILGGSVRLETMDGHWRMKLGLLILLLIATPAFGATPTDTTVAFYHGAPDRAGNYIVPGLTWQSAGAVRRDQAFDGQIEGHIYAQPLYWRPPGSERGLIITATENDLVYALDADTGRVVWRTSVGRPVPWAALPCGNIDPLGTWSMVCGSPTATCCLVFRSTSRLRSARAASISLRPCKTSAAHSH